MKKRVLKQLAKIILVVWLIFSCSSLIAQQVIFGNSVSFSTPAVLASNGHMDRIVYDTNNMTLLVGTNWLAQLYYTPGANESELNLIPLDNAPRRFRLPGTTVPGTWSSLTKTFTNVIAGGTATLQVRVWDGALYNSYEQAVAASGITGKSFVFNYTVPDVFAPPSAYFMEGLQSFTLNRVSNAPPVITIQPHSTSAAVGSNVVFSVFAFGAGELSYQWLKNGTNLIGQTASSLSFASVQPADAGIYSVIVSNSFSSVISSNAQLTVDTSFFISTQPVGGKYIAGTPVSLSVVAGGVGPFTYKWLKNYSWLSGATSSSLSFDPVQEADSGTYSVLVSNVFGSTLWSEQAQLTVGVPPFIVTQPGPGSFPIGSSVAFYVGVGGTLPLNFQWMKDGTNIIGETTSWLSLEHLESKDSGSYSVVVSNAFGSVLSSNAVLTVNFGKVPAGRYSGLFFEDTEIKHETSGYFTFWLDRSGRIVGTIRIGGAAYPFTSRFSKTNDSASIVISRAINLPKLDMNIQFQGVNETVGVVGTVSDGAWIAALRGDRADYLNRTNAPQAGVYRMNFFTDGDGAVSPGNSSYARAVVTKSGIITMVGELADDTLIGQSTTLAKDGAWPLYIPLYKGRGCLLGWVTFTNTGSFKEVSGNASWIKTKAFGPYFQQGFTNDITIVGSSLTP